MGSKMDVYRLSSREAFRHRVFLLVAVVIDGARLCFGCKFAFHVWRASCYPLVLCNDHNVYVVENVNC